MRIVQIVNTLDASDGGPARNSFELNLALNRIPDVDADLVWIHGELEESVIGTHRGELPSPGPRKFRLVRHRQARTITLRSVLRAIRRADVVILHGYFLVWVPIVAALCRINKVPFVITPHGSLTTHQARTARGKKRIFETVAGSFVRRWNSRFVTGSQMEADELREQFPLAAVGVGGVGTALFAAEAMPKNESDVVRLLSVSRIAPKKRIDLMLDALRALKDTERKALLVVAGVGDRQLTEELHQYARELKVDQDVQFVGQVQGQAKERLFADADIFLLPSDDENFGIGLAEALAHGLPCITSDRVGAAKAMSPAAGRVLTAPTGETIAQAIVDLCEGSNLESASTAARTDAEREFSWDSVALRWRRQLAEASSKN